MEESSKQAVVEEFINSAGKYAINCVVRIAKETSEHFKKKGKIKERKSATASSVVVELLESKELVEMEEDDLQTIVPKGKSEKKVTVWLLKVSFFFANKEKKKEILTNYEKRNEVLDPSQKGKTISV